MSNTDLSFDVLRGVAIIFVVFIHVNSLGYIDGSSSLNVSISIIFRQFANIAVPLFLSISGYFMARKTFHNSGEYFSFLKKQLPRVLIPFLIWSLFYSSLMFFQGIPTTKIIYKFLTFQATAPLYYILLICQYYILHPVIEKLSQSKTGLAISLTISILSCLIIEYLRYEMAFNIPLYLYAGLSFTWVVFPVLGMYLRKKTDAFNKMPGIVLSIITVIVSIICSFLLTNMYNDVRNSVSAVKVSSFLFSAIFIITIFKYKNSLKINKLMVKIGELSFGIYFSHMLFLTVFKSLLQRILSPQTISNILTQLILTLLIVAVSLIVGLISNKVNKKLSSMLLGY